MYSYVNAQGQLMQGVMPATKEDREKKAAQAANTATPTQAGQDTYTPADEAASKFTAKQLAKQHNRFVTYYNAQGKLIRQHIDPVAAGEHRQSVRATKDYQYIMDRAAQAARDRQYSQSNMVIPANCCRHLIKYADKLTASSEKPLHFTKGEFGWIQLAATHPAHIYLLGKQVKRITIKSYKKADGYLHPYLLLLNKSGTPLLAVNNLFQRRYDETWYRYGYVEGSVTIPAKAAYAILYLPYETGSRATGMQPIAVPSLQPETNSKPAKNGELLVTAQAF